MTINDLSTLKIEQLLNILKERSYNYISRYKEIQWEDVVSKLLENKQKLLVLNEMEFTGGMPALVKYNKENNEYIFFDCSEESPLDRRSLCYDDEALATRKKNKPAGSAWGMAKKLGFELLSEDDYRYLQTLGKFDLKTSSWIQTPADIRKLGGALFCDRRYNTVFTYHNGADSYYSTRGFRGKITI